MMLTSTDYGETAAKCRQLGLDAYLTKPVRQSELLEAILKALGRAPKEVSTEKTQMLSADNQQKQLKILLAEDNIVNQEVVTEILKNLGHRVTVVNNGLEAVEAVRQGSFDMVFMDVQMPQMGGFEATAEIRKIEQSRGGHMPITAMTAHAMKGDRENCLEAGMDDYISKPISVQRVREVIEGFFGSDGESQICSADHDAAPLETNYSGTSRSQDMSAVIDHESLLNRCIGKPDIVCRVLDRFRQVIPEIIDKMGQEIINDNIDEARQLAHTVKGAAANISANSLWETVAEVEKYLKMGDKEEAVAYLPRLEAELKQCLECISEFLSKNTLVLKS